MKLKLGSPQHAGILAVMVGILCVALLDFFRVINIHDHGAGVIYNAMLAAFFYASGGAVALIGRNAALHGWRSVNTLILHIIWLKQVPERLMRSATRLRSRLVLSNLHAQDDFSRLRRINGK